jgi:Ca2+-binding RTX toxin-like protein
MITWDTLEGNKDWESYETGDHYNDWAFEVIAQLEGAETLPYLDTSNENFPTIGIGFNLAADGVLEAVLDAMGLTETAAPSFRADIVTAIESGEGEWGTTGFQVGDLRDSLDAIIDDAHSALVTDKTVFSMTEQDMANAFPVVAVAKEDDVDDWLADIPESRERIALLSLSYNQRAANPLLVNDGGLETAIVAGDRAEAWFEIRYNSNANSLSSDQHAVAARRYLESHVFGLDEKVDSTSVDWSVAEALAAFEMFNRHEEKIRAYDDRYGGESATYGDQIEAANANLTAIEGEIGEDLGSVLDRQDAFAPAREYLAAVYASLDEGHIGEGELGQDIGLAAWGSGANSMRSGLEDLYDQLEGEEQGGTEHVQAILSLREDLEGESGQVYVASDSGVANEVAAHTVDRPSMESITGETRDLIFGTNGADTLLAGGADDMVMGSAGADYVDGGNGLDIMSYAESNALVQVSLGAGTASGGFAAGDTLVGIEDVIGSAYADEILGDSNNNFLVGADGADILVGANGDDIIQGGSGDDSISPGLGRDFLFGGEGADTFVISHDGPGYSEFSDIVFDADTLDAIYLDGERLTHGIRDGWLLEIDEFENEVWVPNAEERWLIGIDDGSIDFRMYGDDLAINIFNEGGEYFESILVKNFDLEGHDLGITLETWDNRPQSLMGGGGGGEQSLKAGELFGSREDSPHHAWDYAVERLPQMPEPGPSVGLARLHELDQGVHGDG